MRCPLCFAFLGAAVLAILLGAAEPQKPFSFIFDKEEDLLPAQEHVLDSLFFAHEQHTGNEIALLTTTTFDSLPAREFAMKFMNKLGVGKKERNNGVAIVFSKTQREVFISTGYGTERVLQDSICKRIIDTHMVPRFKAGQTFEGLWEGSKAVVEFLERPENAIR